VFDIGNVTYNGTHPLVVGILNITHDSFYDGGRYIEKEQAVDRALEMVDEGADIIDIGAESTRPGAQPVPWDEEIARVVPVIKAVAEKVPVPISVDTCKAQVALRAYEAGACIINDISALRFDPDMVEVIKETECTVILMHMLGNPRTMQMSPYYRNVDEDILAFLNERVTFAVEHGISKGKSVVDPGIGFGKRLEDNLELIRRLSEFKTLGRPIAIGTSRKSFIGTITGLPTNQRLEGSLGAACAAALNGASIIRCHDVNETKLALQIVDAIKYNKLHRE